MVTSGQVPRLPADAVGLGLRLPHYGYLFEHWPDIGYFEIISENFLGASLPPRQKLARVRTRYPVVLHGVGLNLLGSAPLDEAYLDQLCRLADEVDAPFVTDHLCWTGAHGVSHHDLLPTPYVPELVDYAAERAAHVQRRLGRPFGLENLSSYVTFGMSTMTEWDFYAAVVRESGCRFLLDVNNIYVSSENHGFDPLEYLGAIDFTRVLQVHLAGFDREQEGTLVDTHNRQVSQEVWALYTEAWKRGGPFPTLLEWDDRIPEMPVLLAELDRAKRVSEANGGGRRDGGPAARRPLRPEAQSSEGAPQVKESPAPAWLAEFQERFGRVLRTPLDRASGTLCATPSAYDPLVGAVDGPRGSASERLAVYNRQYWFRLFTVMQGCFPLVTRLLGHWTFNGYAGRFLFEHAPRGWDIDQVSEGFVTWLATALEEPACDATVEGDAVLNAAELDAAFRAVFLAPEVSPFAPAAEDAPRILGSQLVASPAARVIEERWPLLAVRRSLEGDPSEVAVRLSERLERPRWWALVRKPQGIAHLPLEPREGFLLRLLERHSVGDALARLEAECPESERAELPARTQSWLARGIEHGFWSGMQAADATWTGKRRS